MQTMESSVETATRALDCKDIINNIRLKSASNTALSSQLDEILKKQSEILQISANSLVNSKNHYSEQFMPGALTATPTPTQKSLSFEASETTPKNINTQSTGTVCKDEFNGMDLQQIFNKLQVSVQSIKDSNKASIFVKKKHCDDDEKGDVDNKDKGTVLDMRRIWVRSLVLATHFVTAVWLTLKEDVECNQSQTPK